MTKCYQRSFEFPRVNRRIVEARFDGGDKTSDGGVLLLRQADRLTGLSDTDRQAPMCRVWFAKLGLRT